MLRIIIFFSFCIFLVAPLSLNAQQNSTLFLMQATPQANFVNPAVRNECKWMLGLPFISSLHLEFGNPSFSVMQVLNKQPDNTYLFDGNSVINHLGRTNYLNTEFHTNLFFLSFWKKDNFYTISVNEKADLFVTFPQDLFAIAWRGNSQFEGQHADLNRTGIFLNYRREYAFGIAKQVQDNVVLGIRIKLLFGKLNTSVPTSKMDLYTSPFVYNLEFSNKWRLNTSLPMNVSVNPDNTLQDVTFNGNAKSILLNRSNVGLGFDVGFINYRDEKVTISGSILDLGLIRWTTNGTSFNQEGNYTYHGPLGDTTSLESYAQNLTRILKTEFGITAIPKSYVSFLIPTYYLGATYNLKKDLNAGALLSGKISRYRVTTGVTLSLNKNFNHKAAVSLSWSYLYKSFANFGAGIKLGRSPLQFYAVSDNVLGLIKPLDTKNINLRFGLQLNFGCPQSKKISDCGCEWLRKEEERNYRKEKLLMKRRRL
jgi:hypothetical protein